MKTDALNMIAEKNRPRQIEVLESLVSVLGGAPSVSHVLVRGSFSSGLADRSSDIDLVIGLREADFLPFLSVLDLLMRTEFATLFRGWPDTMVGNMGGRGFVYLAPVGGVLFQLDVYVAPEPDIEQIVENGATVLFDRATVPVEAMDLLAGCAGMSFDVISDDKSPTEDDAIVEILVVFYMLRKRVLRGQSFIVYGQTYMLNDALRKLIKKSLAPASQHWGWYNLDEDTQANPSGRACLDALRAMVAAGPIRDGHDIRNSFDRVMDIINHAAPDAVARLSRSIDAYRGYLGLR